MNVNALRFQLLEVASVFSSMAYPQNEGDARHPESGGEAYVTKAKASK